MPFHQLYEEDSASQSLPAPSFFGTSGSTSVEKLLRYLKIWDIRRKGCIHTYKGHPRGVNATRFTPDGRWVVSGGEDNSVKVFDLLLFILYRLHDHLLNLTRSHQSGRSTQGKHIPKLE
ncbi:unnamed protein product [Lactuca virosa]|uniref:Uncharacterized protein n=1 Tax=Lactuca virosa TaxID=75947 RepID=A0AAU9PW31_9ASTR|nr:unnamed protein product [Lactuca virosa]